MDHSLTDKRRAPAGKHSILVESNSVPVHQRTEREWLQFKRDHADATIDKWQKFAPNMTWDNVIGYYASTPYDAASRMPGFRTGCAHIIDLRTAQFGRNRPIPELARHKTPVENLYATGVGFHPFGGAHCFQGYNCYKIIAEDHGLPKPWEGQPF